MTRSTQAQISVITDPAVLARLQDLSDHIAVFLARKAMVEYRRQDLTNPTLLGEVKFWFQIDPNNGSTVLCYDKHPTEWNIDAILKNITDLEHIFYVQEGVVFWDGRGEF
jgi:hypothetical protein